jgi:hypothetical protein
VKIQTLIIYIGELKLMLRGEMSVDLIPLELYDIDVILGMDCLGTYRAQLDFQKW